MFCRPLFNGVEFFGCLLDRYLVIDECDGRIRALIVPGPGKWFGCFCREFELFIPWCKIVRIGPDIILVDIDEKEAKHKV